MINRNNLTGFFLSAFFCFLLHPKILNADGIPISSPSVYYNLIESHQIAVIEVDKKGEIYVDMFISILDKSGESHEIKFLLPFFTSPASFKAKEENLSSFEGHKTYLMEDAISNELFFKSHIINKGFQIGNYILYPAFKYLKLLFLFSTRKDSYVLGTEGITPIKEVSTEHSKIEIYKYETELELTEILKKYDIPKEIYRESLSYKGSYIYMVTLKTIPKKEDSHERRINVDGICFSLEVNPENDFPVNFIYPLGTGKTWPNPIPITKIYISTPAGVDFRVQTPNIGENIDYFKSNQIIYSMSEEKNILEDESKKFYNIVKVNDGEIKVMRIMYINANPNEDLTVSFHKTSLDGISWMSRRFGIFTIFFIVMLSAIIIWLASFRLIFGWRFKSEYPLNSLKSYLLCLKLLLFNLALSFVFKLIISFPLITVGFYLERFANLINEWLAKILLSLRMFSLVERIGRMRINFSSFLLSFILPQIIIPITGSLLIITFYLMKSKKLPKKVFFYLALVWIITIAVYNLFGKLIKSVLV